jgi:hypothetical protein
MAPPEQYFEFITTPVFENVAKKLLTEEDRRQLELLLLERPYSGPIMQRTGGVRKMRFARPSRGEGKSGGTRVVYYVVDRKARIYLVHVYAKSVKASLTREEEKRLHKLAQLLEAEE